MSSIDSNNFFEPQLRQALFPLYKELMEAVEPFQDDPRGLCPFAVQWGPRFPKEERSGILFVGRATNGWVSFSNDPDVLFGDTDEAIFNLGDQMLWVHNLEGNRNGYNTRRSAFWRVIRGISSSFYPNPELSYVSWSNVTKVAPDGANPSDVLYYAQLEVCQRILAEEIRILSPRFVVFLTGYNWAIDFLRFLNGGNAPTHILKEPWGDYEACTFRIRETTCILSEHPMGKPEKAHIEAINKLIKASI